MVIRTVEENLFIFFKDTFTCFITLICVLCVNCVCASVWHMPQSKRRAYRTWFYCLHLKDGTQLPRPCWPIKQWAYL